jgi:hypothetical protein
MLATRGHAFDAPDPDEWGETAHFDAQEQYHLAKHADASEMPYLLGWRQDNRSYHGDEEDGDSIPF